MAPEVAIVSLTTLAGGLLRRTRQRLVHRLRASRAAEPGNDPRAGAVTPAQQEFEQLGPWMSRFVVDGVPRGGTFNYGADDPRLAKLAAGLGSLRGKRILELGALEGGHALHLARAGASVVAIEGRPANYQRCLFVKRHFQLDGVEFALADLRTLDFARWGRFDAILNSGVLYHLDRPWDLLARLGDVADRMLLWTHFAHAGWWLRTVEVGGIRLRGRWHPEREHPLSGVQPRSFWPIRESLERMLHLTGWTSVTWLQADVTGGRGPAATIWAERGTTSRSG